MKKDSPRILDACVSFLTYITPETYISFEGGGKADKLARSILSTLQLSPGRILRVFKNEKKDKEYWQNTTRQNHWDYFIKR